MPKSFELPPFYFLVTWSLSLTVVVTLAVVVVVNFVAYAVFFTQNLL